MASIIKVDRILDSTELGKVDIPGGIETDVLNATELIADTWKNVDGTENYKCRAWVNFDGTTTPPTIRASGNVSSVVRNGGTGVYRINFTKSLEDQSYTTTGMTVLNGRVQYDGSTLNGSHAKTNVDILTTNSGTTAINAEVISVAIFR